MKCLSNSEKENSNTTNLNNITTPSAESPANLDELSIHAIKPAPGHHSIDASLLEPFINSNSEHWHNFNPNSDGDSELRWQQTLALWRHVTGVNQQDEVNRRSSPWNVGRRFFSGFGVRPWKDGSRSRSMIVIYLIYNNPTI